MAKYDKETKFYWLQLKEDFFEEDSIEWLEEQENGHKYSLFYLKLCLKSLKTNGILVRKVGNMLIPYDNKKLAEMTKMSVDTVIVAMELLKGIGLVQVLENGELYITQLENMVGSTSKSALKKQQQRALQKQNQLILEEGGQGGGQMSTKDKDKDRIKDINNNTINTNVVDCDYDNEFELLWKEYPNKKGKAKALTFYKKARKNGTTFEEVQQGIVNYNKEIEFKKTDKNYIKHGSTWFNNKSWTDEYEVEEVKNKNKPTGRRVF